MTGASNRGFKPLSGGNTSNSGSLTDSAVPPEEEDNSSSRVNNNLQALVDRQNNEEFLPSGPSATPVGGRIQQFTVEWQVITTDKWVLNIVRNGYSLRFSNPPPSIPPVKGPSHQQQLLHAEVESLLLKQAVEVVPPHQRGSGVYSRYFLAPYQNTDPSWTYGFSTNASEGRRSVYWHCIRFILCSTKGIGCVPWT
mgnify:CR=1 FL=1